MKYDKLYLIEFSHTNDALMEVAGLMNEDMSHTLKGLFEKSPHLNLVDNVTDKVTVIMNANESTIDGIKGIFDMFLLKYVVKDLTGDLIDYTVDTLIGSLMLNKTVHDETFNTKEEFKESVKNLKREKVTLDYLLDKISFSGMSSLNKDDMYLLNELSNQIPK